MTDTRSQVDSSNQDFAAALHEIESNVEVRRLMIVVIHILVPGLAMAVVNATTGTHYPEALAWLPRNVLWIVGAVLVLGGTVTGVILSRCHYGMVVNGAKMAKVVRGTAELRGLNWMGVTTNFLAIGALTAGAGAALVGMATGLGWLGVGAGIGLIVLLMLVLRLQHERAQRLVAELGHHWQRGEVTAALREEHLRKSLDATSADIAIVVTMAVALFAGTFDAMSNVGSLTPQTLPGVAVGTLQIGAMVALASFTLLSLLLSARIVVRLRIALAEHSARLAALRDETDQPWRFRLLERTYLLFLLVMTLAVATSVIGTWTVGGPALAAVMGPVIAAAGVAWYPLMLRRARPAEDSITDSSGEGGDPAGLEPETWWRRRHQRQR